MAEELTNCGKGPTREDEAFIFRSGKSCVSAYFSSSIVTATSPFADNRTFFTDVLPGRDDPIGAPGGARKVGPIGVDTPMVANR